MIALQRIEVEGKRFVLLPEPEYERLCHGAGEAMAMTTCPHSPSPTGMGDFPRFSTLAFRWPAI